MPSHGNSNPSGKKDINEGTSELARCLIKASLNRYALPPFCELSDAEISSLHGSGLESENSHSLRQTPPVRRAVF